jgi:hypothetical protein
VVARYKVLPVFFRSKYGIVDSNPSRRGGKSPNTFFFYLDYETIGTAATPGLFCQPRVIMKMIVESMMECRLLTHSCIRPVT